MKIGILAGTFDPVHAGHIAFARLAMQKQNVKNVVFMVEHHPRGKVKVTPFKHRLAMVKLAIKDDEVLSVYDSQEKKFSLSSTLPKLKRRYKEAEFVIILGSDVARHLTDWKGIDEARPQAGFLVALRSGDSEMSLRVALSSRSIKPKVDYYHSPIPGLTSSQIREAQMGTGIETVDRYIAEHRLYD